ncbi:MFS transporter [Nonomuraea antimicrobica]
MTTVPARIEDLPRIQAQRRTLIVLVAAQVLSGAGLAAGVTVGALLAQDMLSSTSLAGLPSALGTAGSALAAFAVGRVSQARGRRPGLAAGYLAGAVGSAGVIAAAVAGSSVLLFSLLVYGAGMATNLQARYAGADLAVPARRARAVSTVLVATTVGGVVGPNLAAPTGDLALTLGIPYLAGPFLLAGIAYALAALVLAVWLRPDPLLLARALEAERTAVAYAQPGDTSGLLPTAVESHRVSVLAGALVMVLTQLVMVAIMTMTPVHMHDHGHGTAASGLVIAIHIGAMYLPSPLTGWLVDRYGPSRSPSPPRWPCWPPESLPPTPPTTPSSRSRRPSRCWAWGGTSASSPAPRSSPTPSRWPPAPRPRAWSTSPSPSPAPPAAWPRVSSSPEPATPSGRRRRHPGARHRAGGRRSTQPVSAGPTHFRQNGTPVSERHAFARTATRCCRPGADTPSGPWPTWPPPWRFRRRCR